MSKSRYGQGRRTHNACLLTDGLSKALEECNLGLQATKRTSQTNAIRREQRKRRRSLEMANTIYLQHNLTMHNCNQVKEVNGSSQIGQAAGQSSAKHFGRCDSLTSLFMEVIALMTSSGSCPAAWLNCCCDACPYFCFASSCMYRGSKTRLGSSLAPADDAC